MASKFGTQWQKVRKPLIVIAITILVVGVLALVIFGYQLRLAWTGFLGKTLWDWLNLLGVLAIPVVVALGAAWYTAQQGKVSERDNRDNQREAALQDYIDKMSELLLKEHLSELTLEALPQKSREQRTTQQQAELERELTRDNQQEALLQASWDKLKMSELLSLEHSGL